MVRFTLVLMSLALVAGACDYLDFGKEPVCQVCGRPVHKATYYKIFLRGQEAVDVVQAEAADFETGQRLDAREAVYVENSNVHVCCRQARSRRDQAGRQFSLAWDRCLPSLVAFRDRERAAKFALNNGGVIKSYEELTNESP